MVVLKEEKIKRIAERLTYTDDRVLRTTFWGEYFY